MRGHDTRNAPETEQDTAQSGCGLHRLSGLLALAPQFPQTTVGLSLRLLMHSSLFFSPLSAHICILCCSISHAMTTSFWFVFKNELVPNLQILFSSGKITNVTGYSTQCALSCAPPFSGRIFELSIASCWFMVTTGAVILDQEGFLSVMASTAVFAS